MKNSPHVLLIFPPLFWAGNIVLGRGINQVIPPVTLAFWRWTTALLFLIPFTWPRVKKDWPVVKKNWMIIILLSFLDIACFNTMLYVAVHTTTAINGALIQTSMPAWIVVYSLVLFKERVSSLQVVGVVICILGAFHIIAHGNWSFLYSLSFVRGDVWMFAAVILYALYSTLLRKRPATHDLGFLTVIFATGSLMLLPLYIWELLTKGGFNLSLLSVGSILYVALFPSIFSYLCWNRGVELIGANQSGLYINFTPVFASILAVLILNESLYIFHFVGIIMIIGGMLLYNRMK